jgi:hypothetical protein
MFTCCILPHAPAGTKTQHRCSLKNSDAPTASSTFALVTPSCALRMHLPCRMQSSGAACMSALPVLWLHVHWGQHSKVIDMQPVHVSHACHVLSTSPKVANTPPPRSSEMAWG